MAHGSAAVWNRWARQADELAQWTLGRLREVAGRPSSSLWQPTQEALGYAVRTAFEMAAQEAEVPILAHEPFRQLARQGAKEDIPVTRLISTTESSVGFLLQRVWGGAGPGEHGALAQFTSWVTAAAEVSYSELADAYFAELQSTIGRNPSSTIARELLEGRATPSSLRALNVPWDAPFLVVLAPHSRQLATPGAVNISPAKVGHRPLELVDGEEHWLLAALPPGANSNPENWADGVQQVVELFAPGLPVAAELATTAADIARAAQTARRVAALSLAVSWPSGSGRIWTHNHLLLQELLAADDVFRHRALQAVAPLRDHPTLWRTVKELYQQNLDRGRAAARLGISRRALAYRLERISTILGLDPAGVHGVQILSLAISADYLHGREGGPEPGSTSTTIRSS